MRVGDPARDKRGGHLWLQRGVLGIIQDEWRKKGVFLEDLRAFDTKKKAVFASLVSLDAHSKRLPQINFSHPRG